MTHQPGVYMPLRALFLVYLVITTYVSVQLEQNNVNSSINTQLMFF